MSVYNLTTSPDESAPAVLTAAQRRQVRTWLAQAWVWARQVVGDARKVGCAW